MSKSISWRNSEQAKKTGDGPTGKDVDSGVRWWMASDEDLPDAVECVINQTTDSQKARIMRLNLCTKLYSSMPILTSTSIMLGMQSMPMSRDYVSYNIVQSIIDTKVAVVSSNSPNVVFETDGGSYAQERKAKKMSKFVQGVFYENRFHDIGRNILRDTELWGTGLVKGEVVDGRVKLTRALPHQIIVDDDDAVYGSPRSMHYIHDVDREVLVEKYPKDADFIYEAFAKAKNRSYKRSTLNNKVEVRESWHLKSSKRAKDGLHVVTIYGHVLDKEEWKLDRFPFSVIHSSIPPHGFWGIGAAQRLVGLQMEINRILTTIQRAMIIAGGHKILVPIGANIPPSHFDKEIGTVIPYSGPVPPQYVNPPTLPQEYFQHLETLKRQGYESEGVSQLTATAHKPSGLNSGIALREYHDIESERLEVFERQYENFYIDIANLTIMLIKSMPKPARNAYHVMSPSSDNCVDVSWDDVELEEDCYVIKCWPISMLPSTPSGKLQTVQELLQSELIDRDVGMKLLNYPDLNAATRFVNAQIDYCMSVIGKIIDDGKYTPPEPQDNLVMMRKLALEAFNVYRISDLPIKRLDMIQKLMAEIDVLLNKAQQQSQAQAMQQAQLQMQMQQMMNPQQQGSPQVMPPQGNPTSTARPDLKPRSDLVPYNGLEE